jgi:hypothetical protein
LAVKPSRRVPVALVEEIRKAKNAQPFRTFSLRLADGSTYTVKHPDYISVPPVPRPREVIFYVQGADEDYHSHWIQLSLILEMILPSGAEAAPQRIEGNGS